MQPKHAVIIPAYNAANYIEQSVGSALTQLGPHDEIVVINDGSSDDTTQIVEAMVKATQDQRVRLVCQPTNLGIAAARNRGLAELFAEPRAALQADYVHFLDHDDLWPANRVSVINELIEQHHPDVISGWVEHFYCPLKSHPGGNSLRDQYALPANQAASLPGTVVFSRRILDRLGLFDQALSSGEFIEFMSRAMGLVSTENFSWSKTNSILLARRIHGGNHTLTDPHLECILPGSGQTPFATQFPSWPI